MARYYGNLYKLPNNDTLVHFHDNSQISQTFGPFWYDIMIKFHTTPNNAPKWCVIMEFYKTAQTTIRWCIVTIIPKYPQITTRFGMIS